MAFVNVYLNFPGNTEEAFQFYKSVFGGEFLALQRFKDIPDASGIPENDREGIMHIALRILDSITLMGTDALESMGFHCVAGNNVHISLQPDTRQDADQLFSGLSEGGKVEMALQETFWGAYYGSLRDRFGIQWMINLPLS